MFAMAHGRCHILHVDSTPPILDLMIAMEKKCNTPLSEQRWTFRRKQLQSTLTLADYKIQKVLSLKSSLGPSADSG